MTPLVLLCAAEPSGDRLAAELYRALKARGPLRARGVAGPAMRAAGVESLWPAESLGVMGISEVFGRLSALWGARRAMAQAIDAGAQALVAVDSPDLHLPLLRRAKGLGVPAVGYVAPQVWAWRPGRASRIAASMDRMLCLFPFEPPLFVGLDARWVGHPAIDRVSPRDPAEVDPNLYALLPGSRAAELRRHLPLFLTAAERLRAIRGQATRFAMLLPPELPAPGPLPDWIVRARTLDDLRRARGALTKSGTVTLELAVLGVPMVVAHRVSALTWAVGRRLVRGVRHVALPNILADRAGLPEAAPELIQADDPALLARLLAELPERQPVPLEALGAPGQAARAAAAVAELWGG